MNGAMLLAIVLRLPRDVPRPGKVELGGLALNTMIDPRLLEAAQDSGPSGLNPGAVS